jgi:hypothetical protein
MKVRLLVMNGQRIVQVEQGGEWTNQKVDKAGELKPGIYNLYMAQKADKAGLHEGLIVHSDRSDVYQQVGKSFVKHARDDFQKVPEVGGFKSISYDSQGTANVASGEIKLVRGRSR